MKLFEFLLAGIFGLFTPQLAAEIQLPLHQPPGQLINVDGRDLHLNCYGNGRPTVLFDSGLGGFSLDWLQVQDLLQADYQVCAYDRAGYGWSQIGPSPRITEQIIDELYGLLKSSTLQPPFILVGHSFGGLNLQYFSKLYPQQVAGLVLVESSHPEQFSRLPDLPEKNRNSRFSNRLTTMFDSSILRFYPHAHRQTIANMLISRKFIQTQQREFMNFTQSAVQVEQISRKLDVPLAVISRGLRVWPETPYGNEQERIWKELQGELLDLSEQSWQVIANNSQHLVHLQQPDLVAQTIRQVIHQVCDLYPNYQPATDGLIMMCQNNAAGDSLFNANQFDIENQD